jgi:phospholipid/cholesterol/gamma-HCH transport system substrate-binding protein
MESKREQALVGLFVLVAAGLLIVTVFLLSGTFTSGNTPYRAYFKTAGGLGPGAEVRYLNGPPVGRVTKVIVDPQDPARMLFEFNVQPSVPVKTDSKVTITSTSPLGDNFLAIIAGTAAAPRASPGATLKVKEPTSFSDIGESLSALTPQAQELIHHLDDRVQELKETLSRVNDLLSDQNRANISGSLSDVRGMLHENRPEIHSTINNLNTASAKLDKLLDDLKPTIKRADDALAHLDSMLTDNKDDIRKTVQDARKSLASVASLTDQLDRTMLANSENLDEIIDNLRHVTENLKSFTETIKTRPYTLIRSSTPREHAPGEAPPQ